MKLGEVAQKYVDFGFSVIPLQYRGKTPICSWKPYQERRATKDELATWFHRQDRNIGIVTGPVSRDLCVIDFDAPDLYGKWIRKTRFFSLSVSTGKGVHVYVFCSSARTGNGYFQGEHFGEIRFHGGYVVAPPSIHPNGIKYTWVYKQWGIKHVKSLADLEIETTNEKPDTKTPIPVKQTYENVIPKEVRNPWLYANAALSRELEKIQRARAGSRNETLFRAGLKLKKYAGVLGETNILKRLIAVGCAILPEKEAQRTIQSAWHY